ncbi:hypothetical protein CMEL01_05100 [Colletotrichum melonis]|uniref:Uncharacterized protein n=4 Tax=Colletotrichum acutatum species complex TaxID=2707335 RepID=A0AAJ0E7V4_9PEZI|nr:uncharacterized protein CCOS01_00403 [Colletotrichum costaricense]XP_060378398.1 uncharacterized protein CTAM01_10895 [Colletotrichum tamarilloi]KAI3547925.1 hypothetical protein CSPX01_03502 [Colletotrichum filicis]KAK1453441.1 hypothetical protein CMEL01_05100 [Colletotrichum melonis]KAK1461753.1 hypothetical protein CCUS01_01343 [Colletotrichum cuscutae]KAK1490045.1 hypothetical protein CTAM01_10895 [Colletotrichum tamarilloi]KAK1539089.1 hypothetical protein CCOS01_00403 [Colletotrichu
MKPTQDRKDAQVDESSPTIRAAKGGFVTLRAAQRRAAGHASLSLSSGIGAAWRCGNSSLLVVFGW